MTNTELRRKVMTLGNRLSRNLPRHEAFVQAWTIVKAGAVTLAVRGVSFGTRQEALRRLASYEPADVRAVLVPEPENPMDRNAVAVMVGIQGGKGLYRLGYVPREQAGTVKALGPQLPRIRILNGDIFGARLELAV
jgi:hypothetical protein